MHNWDSQLRSTACVSIVWTSHFLPLQNDSCRSTHGNEPILQVWQANDDFHRKAENDVNMVHVTMWILDQKRHQLQCLTLHQLQS